MRSLVIFGMIFATILSASFLVIPHATATANEDKVVVFSSKQMEKTVVGSPGDIIVVKLPARPGTGYNWKPVNLDLTRFKLMGEPTLECDVKSEEQKVGGTALSVFHLKVIADGSEPISFEYKQHFDAESKAKRVAKLFVKSK